jgi:hypothetical protein
MVITMRSTKINQEPDYNEDKDQLEEQEEESEELTINRAF